MKATFYYLALFAALLSLKTQAQQADSTKIDSKIDAEILHSFTGHYQLREDMAIEITEDDGKLYLKAPNQKEKVLFLPKTKTRFFNQLNSAEIEFNRNEEGKVISLTIYNGRGKQMTAIKR